MSKHSDFSSDSWRCRWVCPEPVALSRRQNKEFTEIITALSQFARHEDPSIDCVGIELKLAMLMVGDNPPEMEAGDNDYWDKKCRVLFLRPAIEPIAVSYWNKLINVDLDVERAQKVISALTAKEQVLRVREGVGRSANGNVGFEPRERAIGWLDRLKAAYARPELRSFMPAFTFASTVMAHPFTDGNGRLSRLLTLGALARIGGWRGPIIGLAPSFYRHAEALGESLDAVTLTGDWSPYIEIFFKIMRDVTSLMLLLEQR